ncbi:MAG TPA: two-component system response regulator [Balneolaceae bacterium]|nr:two-component system response regulator [Balneolaceae bacterium]|tara:strand:- start:168076 stop:168450 length:375 start_codon:yes stop_codon:yes gene_type:complete
MKIMIVDDHADMRRVLGNIIQITAGGKDVELFECGSGEEAIVRYPLIKPDCVFMDVELQSMSGFDVTKSIFLQDSDAQVIIITSYDTRAFRQKAQRLNVAGFIPKDSLSEIGNILPTIINKTGS